MLGGSNVVAGVFQTARTDKRSLRSPSRLSVLTARKRYSHSRCSQTSTACGVLGVSNTATTMLSSGEPRSTDRLAISFVSSRAMPLHTARTQLDTDTRITLAGAELSRDQKRRVLRRSMRMCGWGTGHVSSELSCSCRLAQLCNCAGGLGSTR